MMSRYGIDEDSGTVDVHRACPNEGDSVMIVNCGDHFEVRHHSREPITTTEAVLTDEELNKLRSGHIVWH